MKEWAWRTLVGMVSRDAGGSCEVCGGRGRRHAVECHELWLYDDARHVQSLRRLVALCPMCHRVKHFGRSCRMGFGDDAHRWLCRVNGWPAEYGEAYVAAVFRQWQERSLHRWTLDVRCLEGYDVTPGMLGFGGYVLEPRERERVRRLRRVSMEDVGR